MTMTSSILHAALSWRKARRSGGQNCIEVASAGDMVAIRDSKNLTGPILLCTGAAWLGFIAGIKSGRIR